MMLGLCFAAPAQAGLFTDDDARKQNLENRKETQRLEARLLKIEDTISQQTKSSMDLQSQIDALISENRKLRGQNEELEHGLRDAEKRAKDFYVDLDTRLRHIESSEEAAKEVAAPASAASPDTAISNNPSDPVIENRAFEAAYGLFKGGQHANAVKAFHEFLKKYPDSVHVPNAIYWLGSAKYALKDYKGALDFYQKFLNDSPASPKAAEALFNIAGCQQELKQAAAAKKTLKQVIAKYPTSESAGKARKLLSAAKK